MKTPSTDSVLLDKIQSRQALVAVLGLGFVGLPEALEVTRAGYQVVGIDVDGAKIKSLQKAEGFTGQIDPKELRQLISRGCLKFHSDFQPIAKADVVLICVPTPIGQDANLDRRFINQVSGQIASHLESPKLIVVESTVPPGTTREVILPVFNALEAQVGRDFFLAHAPERIDPGNKKFPLNTIPRVVGGITSHCCQLACAFYSTFVERVHPVSSVEVAEASKVMENCFRMVNISFVNEIAVLAHNLGIDIWEVIQACSTKPFGFMPHQPGPGVGGSCVPWAPHYLLPKAKEHGVSLPLLEAALEVNQHMPSYVVDRLADHVPPGKGKILVLGVTYKPNVADVRASPALEIIRLLYQKGYHVLYHDPLIPDLELGQARWSSVPLTEELLEKVDCALVITPHSDVNYDLVIGHCPLVFDTRNALKDRGSNIIRL